MPIKAPIITTNTTAPTILLAGPFTALASVPASLIGTNCNTSERYYKSATMPASETTSPHRISDPKPLTSTHRCSPTNCIPKLFNAAHLLVKQVTMLKSAHENPGNTQADSPRPHFRRHRNHWHHSTSSTHCQNNATTQTHSRPPNTTKNQPPSPRTPQSCIQNKQRPNRKAPNNLRPSTTSRTSSTRPIRRHLATIPDSQRHSQQRT